MISPQETGATTEIHGPYAYWAKRIGADIHAEITRHLSGDIPAPATDGHLNYYDGLITAQRIIERLTRTGNAQ